MRKGIILFLALSRRFRCVGFSGIGQTGKTLASIRSSKEIGMKRLVMLFAVVSILLCVLTYTVQSQEGEPGLNFPPHDASPQASIDFYEIEIKKCRDYLNDLSLEINMARILAKSLREKFPDSYLSTSYMLRIYRLEKEARVVCSYIEDIYKPHVEMLTPPTPTPSPSPSPIETKSKESSDELKKKQLKEYSDEIKFIKDYRKRLKELKTRADKVFKEIDDLFKKTFPNKPIPRYKAETTSTGGLSTTTFTTPQGRIILNLPNGIQAGDKISGTVISEPKGRTEEERRVSEIGLGEFDIDVVTLDGSSRLSRYSLESIEPVSVLDPSELRPRVWRLPLKKKKKPLKGTKIPVKEIKPKKIFPFELEDDRLISRLISGNSRAVLSINDGQKSIPIEIVQLSLTSVEPIAVSYPKQPGSSPWESPNFVQAGRPIPIVGPFDGNAKNTSLELDGKPLTVLAESPRKAFFNLPTQTVGLHEVRIKELGREAGIPYRILGTELSAPKTNLMRGEKTTVTIKVTGLEGLTETEIIPLQLVSSGVINMDGGDSQSLRIRKKDVKNGVFRTTRKVTGHSTGGWGVIATVIDPRQKPIFVPLIRNSKGNGFRQKQDGNTAGFFEIRNVRDPRTGKRLNGNHKLETGCKASLAKKTQLLSLRFKNGNSGRAVIKCLALVVPRIIIQDDP